MKTILTKTKLYLLTSITILSVCSVVKAVPTAVECSGGKHKISVFKNALGKLIVKREGGGVTLLMSVNYINQGPNRVGYYTFVTPYPDGSRIIGSLQYKIPSGSYWTESIQKKDPDTGLTIYGEGKSYKVNCTSKDN